MDNSFASKLREINAHELGPRSYAISARELVEKACIAESESRLSAAFYGKPLIANIMKAQERVPYTVDKVEPIPYLEKSYALPFKISKEMLEDDRMYPGKIIYEPEPNLIMRDDPNVPDNGLMMQRPYYIDAQTKLVIDAMVTNQEERGLIIALVAKVDAHEGCFATNLSTLYLRYNMVRIAIDKYLDSINY